MRLIGKVLFLSLFSFLFAEFAAAGISTGIAKEKTSSAQVSQKQADPKIVDVNNKFCPITGNKVSGKDFVVYKGKRYALCCPACKAPFEKNPEKYIKIIQEKEGLE
jgi:YHS domain-containing protein